MKTKRNLGLLLVVFLLLVTIPLTAWSVKNLRFETRKKATEPEAEEFSKIIPLNIQNPIYSFKINGSINFFKENSFLRIILIDKNQNEYLVYEAYPLIVSDKSFSFTDACEETCLLEAIIPESLRIDGYAASYQITKTSFEDKFQNLPSEIRSLEIARSQSELKKERESQKIAKLNEQIKAKGLKWIAGETSVSKLSYAEKKKLFSKPDGTPVDKLPNLQGFEYYKGGVFEIESDSKPETQTTTEPSNLPESWDWRNVHGENWLTSIKDQGPHGTCMLFSTVAALESLINLYKNEHINYDLSEQNLDDCCGQPTQCLHQTACCLSREPIFEEFCVPYIGETQPTCLTQCPSSVRYQFSDISHYIWPLDIYNAYINNPDPYVAPIRERMLYPSFDNIKKEIILKGPLIYVMASIPHSVLLVGYEANEENLITIFKNSWGESWGENGYGKELLKPENLLYWKNRALFVSLKGISPFNNSEIKCVDKDNDKYCNWGISENKPDTCPSFCKPEKDCDDSNPNLGPFDENLNCILLSAPTPTPPCISEYGETCWDAANMPEERACCVADVPQASCEQTGTMEKSCVVLCSSHSDCPANYPRCLIPGGYCVCLRSKQGNLNCDYEGKINNEDLNILLNNWAPVGPVPTPNPGQKRADLNEDQKVNETDLTIPLQHWLP